MNFTKVLIFSLTTVVLSLIGPVQAVAAETERNTIEDITKQYGPIVPANRMPVLHAYLSDTFTRLGEAQERIIGENAVSINKFYIIDSIQPNAFVVASKDNGIGLVTNIIFLTTGMIKKIADVTALNSNPLAPEELINSVLSYLLALIGINAHELAHPNDIASNDTNQISIKTSYTRLASQAIEVRADIDAIRILKEAGMPGNALLKAMKVMLQKGVGSQNFIESSSSTHPDSDLRQSLQKLFLIIDRMLNGEIDKNVIPSVSFADAQSIVQEISNIKLIRYLFNEPENMMTAIQRALNLLKDLFDRDPDRNILMEFNYLIIAIEKELYRRQIEGLPVSAEEKNGYMRVLVEWLGKSDGLEISPNHPESRTLFHPNLRGHEFYRSRLDFYSDPELIEKFRFALEKSNHHSAPSNGLAPTSSFILFKKIAEFTTPQTFYTEFADEILRQQQIKLSEIERADFELSWLIEYIPGDHLLRLWLRSASQLLPRIYKNPSLWSFRDKYQSATLPLLIKSIKVTDTNSVSSNPSKGLLMAIRKNRLLAKHGNVESIALEQELKDHFAKIWGARGYFATLESAFYLFRIDWGLIVEVLGLDRNRVLNDIARSVDIYTSGNAEYDQYLANIGIPSYAEFVGLSANDKSAMAKIRRYGDRNNFTTKTFFPEEFTWATDSTYYQLSGASNFVISGNPELKQEARQQFANRLLSSRPEIRQKVYIQHFMDLAKDLELSTESVTQKLSEVHHKVVSDLMTEENFTGHLQNAQFEIVKSLKLPPEVKRRWLGFVFFRDSDPDTVPLFTKDLDFNWSAKENIDPDYPLGNLIKHDVVKGALDAIFRLKKNAKYSYDKKDPLKDPFTYPTYYYFLEQSQRLILEEITSIEESGAMTFERILQISSIFQVYKPKKVKRSISNSPAIIRLRDRIVQAAEKLALTQAQKLNLFLHLTSTGPTDETDRYFKDQILPFLEGPKKIARLERILHGQQIHNRLLALELTKLVLNDFIDNSPAKSRSDLAKVIEKLNEYVPKSLSEKDRYLESLGWRFNLQENKTLRAFVEDQKGRNWRKANPWIVNLSSAVSGYIKKMNIPQRLRFLKFLMDPNEVKKGLPKSLLVELQSQIYKEMIRIHPNNSAHAKAVANSAALLVKYELELALNESTTEERVPLFELVLTSGFTSLESESHWPLNVIRSEELLNYAEGSDEDLMLRAYLKVIPADEISYSLAYLLSQKGTDKSSINSIFELFGTVGIKFGQLSSIFELFGKAYALENAKLKDGAEPMTLFQIYEAMDDADPKLRDKIELVEVIGTAGIKTVVRVRYKGDMSGHTFVGMFRKPKIVERIEMNIELGLRFLQELESLAGKSMSAFLRLMIEAFREQLQEEVLLTLEGEKTERAREAFEKLNKDLAPELNGWSFRVPRKVPGLHDGDTISFYEEARGDTSRGIPWDKLAIAQQKEVGRGMTKASLAMLFRLGVFDPDRHKGNWLFDPVTKTIWCIDFGQFETFDKSILPWQEDSRLVLAEFIVALRDSNVKNLAKQGLKMRKPGSIKTIDHKALELDLATVMRQRDARALQSRLSAAAGDEAKADALLKEAFRIGLVGVMEAYVKHGVELEKRFVLGAMKGLMILFGERYVSYNEFYDLIHDEIKWLLLKKAPLTAPYLVREARKAVRTPTCADLF